MTTLPINKERMRLTGLTRVEVLVIVVGLAAGGYIVPQNMARARATTCRISCVNNVKQIGLACKTWALDHKDQYPMAVSVADGGVREIVSWGIAYPAFLALSNELNTPKVLICPEDHRRNYATNFECEFDNSHLSYFIGIDAEDARPQMFLSGDRNLTLDGRQLKGGHACSVPTNAAVGWTSEIHSNYGNVLIVDGSVQQWSSKNLQKGLIDTGMETNRLAIP